MAYFFFIIGIVVSRNKDAINFFTHKWKYILLSAAGVSGIYVFWEGFSRYIATGNYLSYYSKWRPSVLVYTVSLGFILFHLFEKPKLQFPSLEKLSKLSFLVFFIHVIVLEWTWSLFGRNLFILMSGNTIGRIIFDPIFFGIVAGTSLLSAFILHKIPKLQEIIG
jgi:surface polysaccharide O-acyltransferase-like enzyme